jgi:hypothetical protein
MKRYLVIILLALLLMFLIGQIPAAHAQGPIVPPPTPTLDPIDQANRDAANADAQAAQYAANASAANANAQAAIAQAQSANAAAEQARQAAAAARAYAQQQQTQAALNAANDATVKAGEADRVAQEARQIAAQSAEQSARIVVDLQRQAAARRVAAVQITNYAREMEVQWGSEHEARREAERNAEALRVMVLVLAGFAVTLVLMCLALTRKTATVQIIEERTTLLSGQRRMPTQGETFSDSNLVEAFDRKWESASHPGTGIAS